MYTFTINVVPMMKTALLMLMSPHNDSKLIISHITGLFSVQNGEIRQKYIHLPDYFCHLFHIYDLKKLSYMKCLVS